MRVRSRASRAWAVVALLSLSVVGAAWAVASIRSERLAHPHPWGNVLALEERIGALERVSNADISVGPGPILREGARGPRVARLNRRLVLWGDLAREDATDGPTARFDESLRRAVEGFQRRHGIEADGVVGAATLRRLDVSRAELLDSLERNLEARRVFETPKEGRYVLVNIPDFHLAWVREGRAPVVMRVAVGRSSWKTPAMADRIEWIQLNPSWHVPETIVRSEIAPRLAEDPDYLEKHDMRVMDGPGPDAKEVDPSRIDWDSLASGGPPARAGMFEVFASGEGVFPWSSAPAVPERIYVVRAPGAGNPLGRIKFAFPNNESIYLHDTPDRGIFDEPTRAVSHGCIRVEDAVGLASVLIENAEVEGWDRARIERAIERAETVTVDLGEGVPIRLVYWTAWVDRDGLLHVRDDIYRARVERSTDQQR